ncbi:hypothetical protein CBR_g83324, partial [Chara braunii]
DPAVKYLGQGFSKDAVGEALKVYKDDEKKVTEFCINYSKMIEMGFASQSITSSLAMYDNDVRRALAHLIQGNGT